MPFCPNCGVPTVAGANSCAQCGHALGYAPPPPVTYASQAPPAAPAYAPTMSAPPYDAPTVPTRKARPVGVAIFAVLQWIGAGFLVLYSIVLMFMGPLVMRALRNDPTITADQQTALNGFGPLFVVLGILMLAFAGLSVWIGWGLWVGKNWARITSIVLAAIGGGFTAIGTLAAFVTVPAIGLFYLVFVAWYAFQIWYWTRPGVRAYFEPRTLAPASGTSPNW